MNNEERKSLIREHNRASGPQINDPDHNPDHGMTTKEAIVIVLSIAAAILAVGHFVF